MLINGFLSFPLLMLTTNLVIDPSNYNIVLIYLEFINYACDIAYKPIGMTFNIFNIKII